MGGISQTSYYMAASQSCDILTQYLDAIMNESPVKWQYGVATLDEAHEVYFDGKRQSLVMSAGILPLPLLQVWLLEMPHCFACGANIAFESDALKRLLHT